MKKAATILTVVCAALGIPLAGLVFLAGGMKSVPGLELGDLLVGLPLATFAVLFGGILIVQSRRSKAAAHPLVWVSAIGSLLAVVVLVTTYLDYHR